MKTNKILSALAAGLVLVGAASCTDKANWDPAPIYSGEEVYFSPQEIGTLDIETDATSVDFKLYRSNGEKAATVVLNSTVTDPDGEPATEIFDCPTEVTFPAGETVVNVPVGITFSAVTAEKPYTLKVTIGDGEGTPYGPTEATFTLLYATKYTEWEQVNPGEYVDVQMGGAWDYNYQADLFKRTSTNMPGIYQFKFEDPFSDAEWEYIITINENIPVTVEGVEAPTYLATLNNIDTGVEVNSDGDTYIMVDNFTFWKNYNPNYTTEQVMKLIERNEMVNSYYQPATGKISLQLIGQTSANFGTTSYSPSFNGEYIIQLPGFKTYEIYAFQDGVNIDATGAEEVVFEIIKGADTYAFKSQLVLGSLEGAALENAAKALAENEDIAASTEDGRFSFPVSNGTTYTLVVAALGEDGALVKHLGKTFTFTSTQPADGYKTIGYAKYTDGFMSAIFEGAGAWSAFVEVQEKEDEPGIYRLKNAYRQWAYENEQPESAMRGNYYLNINAKDANLVYIEKSNLGLRFSPAQGNVFAYSMAAEMLAEGKTPMAIKLQRANGTLKNGVITFSVQKLYVGYENDAEWTNANLTGTFRLDLNTLTNQVPAELSTRVGNKTNTRSAAVRLNTPLTSTTAVE